PVRDARARGARDRDRGLPAPARAREGGARRGPRPDRARALLPGPFLPDPRRAAPLHGARPARLLHDLLPGPRAHAPEPELPRWGAVLLPEVRLLRARDAAPRRDPRARALREPPRARGRDRAPPDGHPFQLHGARLGPARRPDRARLED